MYESFEIGEEKRNFSGWPLAIVLIVILFSALGFIHYKEMSSLFKWWGVTSKFGHSLLIFPVIAFLIFEKRHELSRLSPTPASLLLIPLAFVSVLTNVFSLINIQVLSESLFILMFPLILWLVLGIRVISCIGIPLILLVTTAPIWELLTRPLTELTADAAHISLNILNVPVFREGNFLRIPEGIFEIAEGCGGFRYFIVGLSLGLIYSYTNFRTTKRRVIVVCVAVLLSIVSNWIRVMVVIWAGHVTDMQHPYVQEHVNLGWYIFAATFFVFFFISNRFSSGIHIENNVHSSKNDTFSPRTIRTWTNSLIALSIIVLVPYTISHSMSFPQSDTQHQANKILPNIPNWSGPLEYQGNWKPKFAGAAGEEIARYTKNNIEADVYIAYYKVQTQDNELINYNNSVINNNWSSISNTLTSFDLKQNTELSVNEMEIKTDNKNSLVWFWYYVAGSETSDRRIAKIAELRKLFSSQKLSAVIAVMPYDLTSEEQARNNIGKLIKDLHPRILENLNNYD